MTSSEKIRQFLDKTSDISIGYSEINFFDSLKLDSGQIGYRIDPKGRTLIEGNEGDWKEEWVVIGNDELGDPIIVDTGSSQLTVLNATHGEGAWEPFVIADSLDNFQQIISILDKISENRTNPFEFMENPISDSERLYVLKQIEQNNPNTEISYWEACLEDVEEEEDEDED